MCQAHDTGMPIIPILHTPCTQQNAHGLGQQFQLGSAVIRKKNKTAVFKAHPT